MYFPIFEVDIIDFLVTSSVDMGIEAAKIDDEPSKIWIEHD